MYVNSLQKALTYVGYYLNEPARVSARSVERITRPMPEDDAYWLDDETPHVRRWIERDLWPVAAKPLVKAA